jgi:bifunctional oligoribonuclease and PAP phosphatase NrnA
MVPMSVDWDRLAERVAGFQSFVLTSHIRPDCDALGSELGMAGILRQLGKEVVIVNGHPTPPGLAFLDPHESIQILGEHVRGDELKPDCIMVLDTSAWAQLGPMGDVLRRSKAVKLVLDHHVGEDDLGAEFYKDTSSEATGSLVTRFAQHLKVPITKQMATALYTAVATDTGWFRFASTTSDTYRIIADLVDAGARPSAIYGDLYERDTLGRVRLRGRILSRVEAELDGTLMHTYVVKEDFTETGALPSDTEDAINLTLAITGTKVALIFIEQLKGGFKVSFRSRCHVDCNQLARNFGGGGHRAAAGAFLEGTLNSVQEVVLAATRSAMNA